MNYNKIFLLIAFFLSLNSTNLVYVSNADPSYPVQVIDVDTRTLVGNVTDTYVESMGIAANSSGTKLYLVNRTNQSLDVIDVYQNAVVSQIPLGNAAIYQVAITPDNSKAFVTSNGSSNFYEVDLVSETVTNHSASVLFNNSGQIVITEDGAKAYIGNFGDNTIVAWDIGAQTGAYVDLNGYTVAQPQAINLIPNSNKIYIANYLGANNQNVLILDKTQDKIIGLYTSYWGTCGASSFLINSDGLKGYLQTDNCYGVWWNDGMNLVTDSNTGAYWWYKFQAKIGVYPQTLTLDSSQSIAIDSSNNINIRSWNGGNSFYITIGGNPQALVAVNPTGDDFSDRLIEKYRQYFV